MILPKENSEKILKLRGQMNFPGDMIKFRILGTNFRVLLSGYRM